jgi:tripartite-type tricarboxylate transporter receptor subunit TctC
MQVRPFLASLIVAAVSIAAHAATDFPVRPIRLVSPFAAGAGAVDLAARVVGDKMSIKLNSPVVMVYQPGAAGNLAANAVAKAPKDGYTVFFGSAAPLGYARMVNKDTPFDPAQDFTALAVLGTVPVGVFVNASSDIRTLPDLIAAAKARPGKISFSSPGVGSVTHVAMEILMHRTGIKLSHVPYGAQANYWTDLASGTSLDIVAGGITGGLPFVKDGRIRLIATLTQERSAFVPEVPAAGETVPGYDAPAWLGFAVAAGTPEPIVAKLEATILEVLRDPSVATTLGRAGIDVAPLPRAAFAAKLARERPIWEATLRDAGLLSR